MSALDAAAYLMLGLTASVMFEYAGLIGKGGLRALTLHVTGISISFGLMWAYLLWPSDVLAWAAVSVGVPSILIILRSVRQLRKAR